MLNKLRFPWSACLARLCVSLWLLLATPGHALNPTAYGEQFVRVGQSWAEGGPAQNSLPVVAGPEQGDRYQQQVESLELQGGPYDQALAEPLAGLGRHYRRQGDLQQAQVVYRRALHIVRINDGLYSKRQIPILRELLDAYREAGELETLDDRYDYYFRLYGNGRPPYTEVRLRASLEYLRWQREALRLELDGKGQRRLLALYELNDTLLEEVALQPPVGFARYRDLVYSQLRNLYLLQDRVAPPVEITGVSSATASPSFGAGNQSLEQRQLELIQRGGLSRGTALLQQLALHAAVGATELAHVYLELADWQQWNGSEHLAEESYAEVVRILREAGETELLRQWLEQPVELPDNGAFWQPRPLGEGERQVVVNARFDVSARGRVTEIETVVADPDDEGLAKRLRRRLAKTRFRPRWLNGQAEAVVQLERDYELID
jgi:tetratricopeptide (TPR) repeat protein